MHAIKTPSFFRPASRPSSPAAPPSRPDSGAGMERARPLVKLSSLTTFRRASPAPGLPATTSSPAPLVQDGSYLEMLSLKLSEAVSKSLIQPNGPAAANEQVAGRRALPPGRGHALGSLIASELRAANENPNLYRAILRSLHRPLSVLLGNLSSLLVPLLSSPLIMALPCTAAAAPVLNPYQLHAVGISALAGELLETFDDLALGLDGDIRGDGLKQIREGLASVVNRIVGPFLGLMKNELLPLIEALEAPSGKTMKPSPNLHPSIITLQSIMPAYSKAIARYTSTATSQTLLATHLISFIWKGLVALTSRPYVPASPPASPFNAPVVVKKRRGSPTSSPPPTPPARFVIKLPSSRPPSPPLVQVGASTSADSHALFELLNMLPRPDVSKKTTCLAREAVDEAYDGLEALSPFIDTVYSPSISQTADEAVHQFENAAADIPTLIALPIMLHVFGRGDSVSSLLGLTEESYRSGCLTGFGRADECAGAVGQRVLDLHNVTDDGDEILCKWLEVEIAEDML